MIVVYGFRINGEIDVKYPGLKIYKEKDGYVAGIECGWIPFLGRAVISDKDKALVDNVVTIEIRNYFLISSD